MARVLLIDDDPDVLELLGEWLSGRGHEVATLSDGLLALETALAFDPEVVVLDGLLRGTTGVAIERQLREAGLVCRIIYLSGLSRWELPTVAEILEKPLDLADLDRALSRRP